MPQKDEQDDSHDEQVPIGQALMEEDGAEIALTAKLLQDIPRGATSGKGEIGAVTKVGDQADGIDYHKDNAQNMIIATATLLDMTGQEEPENKPTVEVENGGGVEPQTGQEQMPEIAWGEMVSKQAAVAPDKEKTCQRIGEIHQQQIANQCNQRRLEKLFK